MIDGDNPPADSPSKVTPFVVGVDGGGTGSRAMVMDLSGRELGKAHGPPALVNPSNPGAAADAIALTVRKAVAQADLELPARALWTGLAGAGRSGAREAVEIALRSQRLALETRVGMDVEGARQDAFGPEPGFLLAVGTGSMVWGRDPEGREVRVGGWGGQLGEEGSGYWFGMEGMRAVLRASDLRDPPTRLTKALLGALQLPSAQDLVPWVAQASKAEVGALAPLVLGAAARGDPAARAILAAGLEALGRHLDVVRKVWAPWGPSFPLAVVGGLLEEGGLLRGPMLEIALERGADLHPDPVIPARGAARLALGLLPTA
ncbi:MAG: BadF/BadG/BcrA/BcrD ATPase family protein [Gemmatimonadota bacterium]